LWFAWSYACAPIPCPALRNFFLLLVFCAATYGFYRYFSTPNPKFNPPPPKVVDTRIDPSGGEYFFKRVELPVKLFRQGDPRWNKDPLAYGGNGDTLGSAGCALTSTAMVLLYYGVDIEPKTLNQWLLKHDGFTPEGWLKWEVAAEYDRTRSKFVYEDVPKYKLIDDNLKAGNPVIVRIRYPDKPTGEKGITHFVVICGKDGHDYLVRDPGSGSAKGIYPLKEFGSKIEALRYYEKLTPPPPPAAPVINNPDPPPP
jgi:hypothetical protein